MNMQQDEAFLSLLSSQRQLLSQLKAEIKNQSNAEPQQVRLHSSRLKPTTFIVPTSDDMYADNQENMSRRSSLDVCSEQCLLPSFHAEDELVCGMLDISGHTKQISRKRSKNAEGCDSFKWKKRRLSSMGLGFLSDTAFKDDIDCFPCDISVASITNGLGRAKETEHVTVSDHQTTDSEDEGSFDSASVEMNRSGAISTDPSELKRAIEDFDNAMRLSQKTQQDIHDWDRKMGLKRSHSKTMRLSSRSRKQLRAIMKREIISLGTKL